MTCWPYTYLFTLQRDVFVSLKAHIPTGFIYVAKMTHISYLVRCLGFTFPSVCAPNEAELGRNLILTSSIQLSSINFNYFGPKVKWDTRQRTNTKEWFILFRSLDESHNKAPHTKTPREISQAASLFAASRYPSSPKSRCANGVKLYMWMAWKFLCVTPRNISTLEKPSYQD